MTDGQESRLHRVRWRIAWAIAPAHPDRVESSLDNARREIEDCARGEKPHAKERAQMAVGRAKEILGLDGWSI